MAEKFAIGDVARLNSSADRMTVEEVRPDGKIVCVWLNADVDLVTAEFHPEQLVKLPNPRA